MDYNLNFEWELRREYQKNNRKRYSQCPFPIIGLTGGIASGKSTVLSFFKEKNIPTLSLDLMIKEIYSEPLTLNFIEKVLPQAVEIKNNVKIINFKFLRSIFFSDAKFKEQIEKYLYGKLSYLFSKKLEEMSEIKVIVLEIPLLFEKNLEDLFDQIICVASKNDMMKSRMIQRDKIENDLAEKMLKSQLPIDVKTAKSDFVIINDSGLDQLKEQTFKIIDKLFFKIS
jgi:dephospho-CoA kinase